MHKRNKKNKHKNPTPPQQPAVQVPVKGQENVEKEEERVLPTQSVKEQKNLEEERVLPAQPVKEQENAEKEKERVPDVIPEASIEANAGPATPAKPKRHRAGKKKKNENKEEEKERTVDKAVEEVKVEIKEAVKGNIATSSKDEITPAIEIDSAKKMSVPKPSAKENTVIEEKSKLETVLKETVMDKLEHQKISDKPIEPPCVTPVARKKKGKQHKNETQISTETTKEIPIDVAKKEIIATETETEEKSNEKPLIKSSTVNIVTLPTEVHMSSALDIKEPEILIEDTSANEQKGGKKKNKKNHKSNVDSIIVPKAETTIEIAEERTEIKPETIKMEETRLKFEELKIVELPKQEDTGKRQRKINICAKDVHIEHAKMDEQKTSDTRIVTQEDFKSKIDEHEANTAAGKKKNKKDRKSGDDNKNFEPIIEEIKSASNIMQIIEEHSENISVIKELTKDEKLEAKTNPHIALIDPTDVSISDIKEKTIEQVSEESPKIEISHAGDQFLPQQIPNIPMSGDDNNNSLISESAPVPEEIINNEFEKLLAETSPSEILPQIVTLPKQEVKSFEHVEPDTIKFTPLSESNVDESCKKLFETLLVTNQASISLPTVKINPPSSNIEIKKGEDFIIRLFEESITPAPPAKDMTTKGQKSESTGLKDKVMEVNKDMEDLKLSIEKSLAELTTLEADNMAEMIAITDYEKPIDKAKGEKVIKDTESQILPTSDQNFNKPASLVAENILREINTPIEKTEPEIKSAEIPKIVNEDTVTPQEITIEPQQLKKGKGKGKSSKPQEPIILVNLELKEITPSCQSPAIDISLSEKECIITKPATIVPIEDVNILEADTPKITENIPEVQDHDAQIGSHDHKGKGKGKNKKKSKNTELVPLTSNVQGSQSQQTQSESHKTETAKSSEGKTETKESDSQKSKDTNKSTDKETKHTDDESTVQNEVEKTDLHPEFDKAENFEDGASITDSDTKTFEQFSGETPPESTSYVIPIESSDMLFDKKETKPPEEKQIENPICSHPKNLLGPPDIPVTSSKNDYKKEKNKNVQTPNAKQAKIKVKDSVEIDKESKKCSKQSQTENKIKSKRHSKSASPDSDHDDEEFVYKYSFRKVFLTNSCNVCKAELKGRRLACGYCNLIFYCSQKHKDEEWPQHQALCFAVSTIVHLKGLKFIYGDAQGLNGQDYRLLRMQVIVSCEKILKRKLLPCEQEALLYPRICCEPACREWKSAKLKDCDGCGLVSYCTEKPQHLTREHLMWCKSYRLYFKLVTHQQNQGRLEPKLPSKILTDIGFRLPDKTNELLAQLYEEKIDMDDVHYAALTQLATAPLTAAYTYQLYNNIDHGPYITNGHQAKTFTIHVVGAELQFEADTLNKWEVFFLHLRPDVQELRVVFVGPELNPSKLPLDLLAKIKMCKQCRQDKRKILFDYQDGQLYHNYAAGKYFTRPDIVCAFNPGLHRITGFGGVDSWPETISCIVDLKVPFCVTSYTKHELPRDLIRIAECSRHQYKMILEPTLNPYASIRPDRNFISDDEMPLIFKNYYVMLLCGM